VYVSQQVAAAASFFFHWQLLHKTKQRLARSQAEKIK
jgi:hypothetical protein